MLKKIGRQSLSILSKLFVRVNLLGKLLEVFHQEYTVSKIIYTQQKVYKKLETVFYDSEVKYGHFQGMKYPELEGVGSELFPKLLGCYELELND